MPKTNTCVRRRARRLVLVAQRGKHVSYTLTLRTYLVLTLFVIKQSPKSSIARRHVFSLWLDYLPRHRANRCVTACCILPAKNPDEISVWPYESSVSSLPHHLTSMPPRRKRCRTYDTDGTVTASSPAVSRTSSPGHLVASKVLTEREKFEVAYETSTNSDSEVLGTFIVRPVDVLIIESHTPQNSCTDQVMDIERL